tara:strand:+ start:3266 stop:3997 length:732 start_codon:yes stop_codon:yes gene_type:complete
MSSAQQEINLYVCNIFLTTVVMMNTYTRPDEIASSRSSRANRLKRLRKMTNQSRKSFSNLYGISQGTLQNWETARFGGLTEKGAHIILQALQKEGIHCNFEWLMYGAGHGPSFDRLLNKEQEAIKPKKVLVSSIDEDLKTFQRLNHDTIHMYVPDDSMEPYYSEGELVAGIIHRKHLEECLGHICIIKTIEHPLQVRLIRPTEVSNRYHLIALNPLSQTNHPPIFHASIDYCAPILWTRKQPI